MNRFEDFGPPEEEIAALIAEKHIVGVVFHPAAMDFTLGDGSMLTLYPDGRDYPHTWRLGDE